jgi:hypothetical protein
MNELLVVNGIANGLSMVCRHVADERSGLRRDHGCARPYSAGGSGVVANAYYSENRIFAYRAAPRL